MLNETGIDILFWGTIAVFFITLLLLIPFIDISLISVLALPGLLLCFLYYPSKNTSSDYLYYFVLDGFMMLSSPLVVLVKFVR